MELIDRIKHACQGISNPAYDPGLLRDHLRELADDIVDYLGLKVNPAAGKLEAAATIPVWRVSAFGNPHISQNGMTYRQWLIGQCAKAACLIEPGAAPVWPDYYAMRSMQLADEILVRMELERQPDKNPTQLYNQLTEDLARA